jgi:hypothetical protein
MRARRILFLALTVAALAAAQAHAGQRKVRMPSLAEIQKIKAAAPDAAPVKPDGPRKLLVWGHVWTHIPNPFADKAIEVLGETTGAFNATISDEPTDLLPERLAEFDALVMNNIHERDPFLPQGIGKLPAENQQALRERDKAIKAAILDFVRRGKGIVGVHAATAAFQNWPEYGEMMGGTYGGHILQDVVIRLDEPKHPINACCEGQPFKLRDEVYIFRKFYSREKLRVLLSLDTDQMADPGKRPDNDYAVSWVRPYGKGRVFYTTLGHCPETYWNALFLRHLLAGIQFALGDLEAEAAPRGQ